MKNYVVIGNGVAAAGCIEGIRSIDKSGSITVISEENHPVYCRPLISYLLENKTSTKKMMYRPDDFYEKAGCKVFYGEKADTIDIKNNNITFGSEKSVSYDKLCIATGSSPFVPPINGLETVSKKTGFMTLDDALYLETQPETKKRVLIIGAGLIGLKCAEGIHDFAEEIIVCDLADRVLSSILDEESAADVQKHLENNGISFMLGDTVDHFQGNTAFMRSGKKIDFDMLVTAVGVRANSSIFKDAGGKCGRAITIDEKMQTSINDIYAAGDCTETTDISDGKTKVMAIMPNAYIGGYTAGVNMAGGDTCFDNPVPMNSIGFFGMHIMTAGSRDGEVYSEKSDDKYKKLYVRDGKLVGFQIIGDVASTGIYTSLIRNQTDLSSVDFDLLKKTPNFVAFSKSYRSEKLGGVL